MQPPTFGVKFRVIGTLTMLCEMIASMIFPYLCKKCVLVLGNVLSRVDEFASSLDENKTSKDCYYDLLKEIFY
jgi:hypothetical protein